MCAPERRVLSISASSRVRSLGTLAFEDGFKSIEPFLSLERVGIVGCLGIVDIVAVSRRGG